MEKLEGIFKKDSPYRQFLASLLMIGLSYGIYKGVLDNYLADIVGIGKFDRGVTEFFRELPGFLLALILAAMYSFSAERIYKIGAASLIVGLAMISFIPAEKALVILSIFVYSAGDHVLLGMKNTLSLEYSKPGMGGRALGIQSSISNAGNIFGYLVTAAIFCFFSSERAYRGTFILSMAILVPGIIASLAIKGKSERDDKGVSRFYFRKKYFKYYMLEVFYGARKQIFFTFGPYVLILFYNAKATHISMLFAISAISCFLLSPMVGRIIDKLGYKIVMVSDTLILIIVCFFYGFAHHLFPMHIAFIVCSINYVLDSVISLASMASNVYAQDLSDSREEMRATIATGISVNHFITILIALFGGWIWQRLGIETLFMLSAILGLCNSAYAATIKTKKKA